MKTVSQELLLTTARNVTERLADEIRQTRGGARALAEIAAAADALERALAERAVGARDDGSLGRALAAQDEGLRAVLAHLSVALVDPGTPPEIHAPVAALRRALSDLPPNAVRPRVARADDGPRTRAVLAVARVDVAALPAVGGQTLAQRMDTYLAACDQVTDAVLRRAVRPTRVSTDTLRQALTARLDALCANVSAEATVNADVAPDLARRILAPTATKSRRRAARPRSVEPVAPAAPAAPAATTDAAPSGVAHAG